MVDDDRPQSMGISLAHLAIVSLTPEKGGPCSILELVGGIFIFIQLLIENCLFVLFGLRLYVPVNNFSVMSGRFPWLNQYYKQ